MESIELKNCRLDRLTVPKAQVDNQGGKSINGSTRYMEAFSISNNNY